MDGAGARTAARRRVALAAAMGVVVLAVLGYAAFEFAGHVTGDTLPAAREAAGPRQTVTQPPVTPSATPAPPATASATATATPTATRTATAPGTTAPQEQVIIPVSAVAFGPHGTADGDNPQIAARVLTDPAMGWLTQWYATPDFGRLKQGTGLLLDMGRTVTITTVRLTLGSPPGADLELRLGAAPEFGALPVIATTTATKDLLSLPLTVPEKARYVLVWFTRLPPDNAGTYQVLVHQITVQGQS